MTDDLYWEIPSSIDLEKLLQNHPPDFSNKIDHFYYIVDYLWNAMVYNDLDENAGFVNVNATKLQKVNHSYKKYLDYLLKHRLLRTDMKYIVGKKSKGYRLNTRDDAEIQVVRIPIKDWKIRQRMETEIEEKNESFEKTKKIYPYLSKWFNNRFDIDVEGVKKEALKLYPVMTGGIRGAVKGKPSRQENRMKALYIIDKIANKEFFYSIDENVGRFHSTLTNLKKEFRNYITYDRQQLVNVDIKNSQPLLSTLLFDKDFYSPKGLFNIHHIPSHSNLLSNTRHSYSSITIMLEKALEKLGNSDIQNYISLVNSGNFYEEVSNCIYPGMPYDKKKVKEMIFIVYFSSNKYIGQAGAESKRRFKKMFPGTYEVFRLLKLCDHTALSRILQRIESIIMIQNVVPRIGKEKPDLPIFTIHDSVVTTVGNEDYVADVIVDEIKRITGLDAKVGKEYWES